MCLGGGGMKGWHPTHKNVSTQVMAGAYDQIFALFFNYCSSQAYTHRHTTRPTPSLWILKRVEMAVGRGFVEGIVSTLFKRVRKGASLAKKSTGLSALPKESAGMKRRSVMERNNR